MVFIQNGDFNKIEKIFWNKLREEKKFKFDLFFVTIKSSFHTSDSLAVDPPIYVSSL